MAEADTTHEFLQPEGGALTLLRIERLTKHFGGLMAVEGLDMTVAEGEIHALIGPNGSGKTTTFNMISSMLKPSSGRITFANQDITYRSPDYAAARGITRTFQQIALFRTMTVLETVMVGAHLRKKTRLAGVLLHSRYFREQENDITTKAREALEVIGLEAMEDRIATDLPYGQQRLVELARALAVGPRLLLLDEPVAGMNPQEIDFMRRLVLRIRDRGITVLLVEHNMDLVMDISDGVTVISSGKKIAEGLPHDVRNSPVVVENYLGKGMNVA
jgi:branched-chain amino acid transport system ATP-binding protein